LQIGFNKLQFFASVQAFKNGAGPGDRGDVWRIANGFRAEELDVGGASMGQNILLMVGDSEEMTDLVDIVITSVSADAAEPFYVSNTGSDFADGSETTPFATLLKAYEAASTDDKRKTIAVLTDLETTGAVELNIENPLTITIRGVTATPPKLTMSAGTNESVIEISNQAKVKFQNITIDGKANSMTNRALYVSGAGTKVTLVRGATITGKTNGSTIKGAGVYVEDGAWLVLSGGEIVDSVSNGLGVGVYLTGGSIFTMISGKISRNTSTFMSAAGLGVLMEGGSTFAMSGGEISGNSATGIGSQGGGVLLQANSTFMMRGGKISGNSVRNFGGGVSNWGGVSTFLMSGGVIYGSNEPDETLKNKGFAGSAAVYITGNTSNVTSTDNTVRFVNGEQVP
jgi:hypothetical protein